MNIQGKSAENPVLNNPYKEPLYHYATDTEGNLNYEDILPGRRPYGEDVNIVPNRVSSMPLFQNSDFSDLDPNAKFINTIRDEVKKWREGGYKKTTSVTRELLKFWFENSERIDNLSLFFCQREAVETAIYLNEVADTDPNIGREIIRQLEERNMLVSPDDINYVLPRTAFKMATGTGKTVVMAMFILYNYLNKISNRMDTRFADHFLIVTPGITIRDRLGVLFVDTSNRSNVMERKDYYHERYLVPRKYEGSIGGLNSCITIINYHQLEPKVFSGKHISPLDGKLKYEDGKMVKQNDRESFSVMLNRILKKGTKGKRIVVINDEAHHCYLPKTSGLKSKVSASYEEDNEKAMVWYEGLRQMKLCGYRIQHVYDLSATPYFLSGSGYPEYSIFPWVVSDFGLVDAIESGLVKIPFLPAFDNSQDLNEPKLRNIYEHIKKELPTRGVNVSGVPSLPTLLCTALDQFVKDYEKYDSGNRESTEEVSNLFSTPPVFIVVCNNTTVSKEVYKYIAGYEVKMENGESRYVDGHWKIFSNYRDGIPVLHAPTLLIDSEQINDAGSTITDDFKQIYAEEIENFKKGYANLHGAGSADGLTEGDILREVVNTVGKPGMLGAQIRCIVSVSMLTEGWDANTVTHVCGIRAFGSQLLCEQVVGRALRRNSYELTYYDQQGNVIEPKNLYKFKPENVTKKFAPEYARVIGVPFKTFRKGQGGGVTRPPKPRKRIYAMPERKDLEIVFPNITGYRYETNDGVLKADFTNVPKFKMDFTEIPTQTVLQTAVNDQKKILMSDTKNLREAQVIYYITWLAQREFYSDAEGNRKFQKFSQIKDIVTYWYYNHIEIIGGDGSDEQKKLVILWDYKKYLANIKEGVQHAAANKDKITAVLQKYNEAGSSMYVDNFTTKNTIPTIKSHVNCVVADTESWEQIAAKTLDELDSVKAYVKNHFLDFSIPYMVNGEEHEYRPDFIARVEAGSGKIVNLIIEISGFSNDMTGNKDAKRHYTVDYWIPAANNLERFGQWDFIEISDILNIKAQLNNKINSL